LLQLSPDAWIRTDGIVIQNHHVMFRERAHGEFTMPRMTDLSDDKNIEGAMKNAGDLRRHHHASTRQSHHGIHFHSSVLQVMSQHLSGFLAGCERHAQSIAPF
jgi:hypothetical protein